MMKIDIKKIVLEEGILDGFKSKTGLGLAGIAGGIAGANIHKDYQAGGHSSIGGYLGQKFGQAKDSFNSAKNDFNSSNHMDTFNSAKNHANDTYNSIKNNAGDNSTISERGIKVTTTGTRSRLDEVLHNKEPNLPTSVDVETSGDI